MDKQIKITLTIDGKEAIATLNMTDEKLKEIFRQTNAPKNPAAITGATKEFTGMNQVIGQTGFLLSDMDMFFRSNDWATNMRMGAMSVSNNFSMVGQTVANAMRQAKDSGLSFTDMLKTSLTGINLWMIGLNMGLLVLQFASTLFSSNTEEVDKNTDAIKKNADALKEKSNIALNDIIFNLEKEVELLKKKKDIEKAAWQEEETARNMRRNMGGTTVASVFEYSGQDELNKKSSLLQQAQVRLTNMGKEEKLELRINELIKERRELSDNDLHFAEKHLRLSEQIKQKQEELNVLQGKEKTGKKIKMPEGKPFFSHALYDDMHYEAMKELDLAQEKNKELIKSAEDRANFEKMINDRTSKDLEDSTEASTQFIHDAVGVELDALNEKSQMMGQVWQRTGNIIATSLMQGLGLLKQTDNVLTNILSKLLEMGLQIGLQLAIEAAKMAIFPSVTTPQL